MRKESVSPVSLISHVPICADGKSGIFGAETTRNGAKPGLTCTPAASTPFRSSV